MPRSEDRYTAYNQPEEEGPGPLGYVALLLSWAVPGLGHLLIGQMSRGIIFAVCIHLLFAGGMLIGGIRAINPKDQQIWTYTQFLAGWPMIVANQVEKRSRAEYEQVRRSFAMHDPGFDDLDARKQQTEAFLAAHPLFAYHPKIQDMGAVYCGIAGMLNLLVMFDVLLRITGSVRQDASKTSPARREATT